MSSAYMSEKLISTLMSSTSDQKIRQLITARAMIPLTGKNLQTAGGGGYEALM
jgi:hypothetical protein